MSIESILDTIITGGKTALEKARKFIDEELKKAIEAGKEKAHTIIADLRKRTQKNIRNTILLDAAMIALMAAMYFLKLPRVINIVGIAAVNLVVLGRIILKIIDFIKKVYTPHSDIIQHALPAALEGIKKLSLSTAIKNAIASVLDWFYERKTSELVKTVIILANFTGILKPNEELKNEISTEFCPIIKKYVIELFVFNFLIFGVCYGVIIFFIRQFFLSNFL
jgi:hypothetical protein